MLAPAGGTRKSSSRTTLVPDIFSVVFLGKPWTCYGVRGQSAAQLWGGGSLGLFLYSLSVCGLCPGLPVLVLLSGHLLPRKSLSFTFPSQISRNLQARSKPGLRTLHRFHSKDGATVCFPRVAPVPLTPAPGGGWSVKERKIWSHCFFFGGGGAGWRLSCEFVPAFLRMFHLCSRVLQGASVGLGGTVRKSGGAVPRSQLQVR